MNIVGNKVKAVGAILINKNGEVLLQKRDNFAPTSPGKISPFGGHVEDNETLIGALTRELMEEIELDIRVNGSEPKLVYEQKSIKDPGKVLNVYLVTNIDDTKLVLHEGESIVKLKSFSELAEKDKSGILIGFDPKEVQELN